MFPTVPSTLPTVFPVVVMPTTVWVLLVGALGWLLRMLPTVPSTLPTVLPVVVIPTTVCVLVVLHDVPPLHDQHDPVATLVVGLD